MMEKTTNAVPIDGEDQDVEGAAADHEQPDPASRQDQSREGGEQHRDAE